MNIGIRERLKSLSIIVLLIAAIVQVGILWGYQSHRFPTSVFASFFGERTSRISGETVRDKLFVPYKLVVSNGYSSHWVLDSDNRYYKQLWEEAEAMLAGVLSGSYGKAEALTPDDWRKTVLRSGFSVQLKMPMSTELLSWFLGGYTNVETGVSSVLKMKIVPAITENSSEIFIYDEQGKAYRFFVENYTRPVSLREITAFFEDKTEGIYRDFSTMADNNLDLRLFAEPDVLYAAKSPRYWNYSIVRSYVPGDAQDEKILAEAILGSDRDRYSTNTYVDGTIQFNNSDNIYRISQDGKLDYRYLKSTSASDKGSEDEALMISYGFMDRIVKLLSTDSRIFLSGINKTSDNSYTFSFGYRVQGLPVYTETAQTVQGSQEPQAEKGLIDVIRITANSKRVLRAEWLLRDFAAVGTTGYNDRYMDIVSELAGSEIPEGIKDLNIGYVIGLTAEMEPVLIIEESANSGTSSGSSSSVKSIPLARE